MEYNYFELRLNRDRATQRAVADHVRAALGSQLVAVFSPLLGFASNQALVLTDAKAPTEAVMRAPGVVSVERWRCSGLRPVIRPGRGREGRQPWASTSHNWFTIDANGFDEFVRLSGEAWPDFEGHFETRIFGLFAARPSKDDLMEGARAACS